MKGFEWLKNEDLYGPVTEEHQTHFDDDDEEQLDDHDRLIDYIACMAIIENDIALLRYALDKGALLTEHLWSQTTNKPEFERVVIDAGYKAPSKELHPENTRFPASRDFARLTAIITMRAMRQMGPNYRDPARMVGRAIWAYRAFGDYCVYFLEKDELIEGWEWLEKENLYGPVTEEHRRLSDGDDADSDDYYDYGRLVDYIAFMSIVHDNSVLLRLMLDKGARLIDLLWHTSSDSGECERVLIDAGYSVPTDELYDGNELFPASRNAARLAAILTMRGMFQKGPARMVGRAIWESRAYYLESVEESGSQKKK